ncbi:protein artemis-like [Neocloeon triangulifer]|uniref:protein artemis-like n=1 Tax=Neocloeon triangulifer TaxID=2078957 RepID=UPI00286ED39A|nr:protein artemis-like [Neocloeon triangulifer]
MSQFSGFIDEIEWISVDSFLPENTQKCTAYFLSHCHADHMRGLNDLPFSTHIASKADHFVYCSEVSAQIVRNMMRDNESLLGKLKPLSLGPNWVQVPIINSDYHLNLVVTLIPAGHCLGSCMFLFETEKTTVLYTGDFRFCVNDYPKITLLHDSSGGVKELDTVYLDTTFWTQANHHFPSRHESLALITTEIDKFRKRTANHGHIHIDKPARIGSEFFIMELSQRYKRKIHVSDDSLRIYEGIHEVSSCITKNTKETFLHMCQSYRPGRAKRRLPCVEDYLQVLHIRPTAQWYSVGGEFFPVREDCDRNIIQISNSMHASRAELVEFVKYFKPRRAVACVVPVNSSMDEVQNELDEILSECCGRRLRKRRWSSSTEGSPTRKFVPRPPFLIPTTTAPGFGEELDYEEN